MFWDRVVEFPGRVQLTDPVSGDVEVVDVDRAEGTVTDEGTTLNRDGFNEASKSYFYVGQESADLIAEELSDTGVTITSGLSGSVKYGKVEDQVIVYCKLSVTTAISGYLAIAGGIPSAYRPATDILMGTRANDRVKVRLDNQGRLSVDGDYPIGTQLFCEFCWY